MYVVGLLLLLLLLFFWAFARLPLLVGAFSSRWWMMMVDSMTAVEGRDSITTSYVLTAEKNEGPTSSLSPSPPPFTTHLQVCFLCVCVCEFCCPFFIGGKALAPTLTHSARPLANPLCL